jgi:predicted Fe-Mo cluster-binding NifX family protein
MAKILIPISGDEIAPRFDLSTEAWIGWVDKEGGIQKDRILLLAHASAEDMCQLAISENVDTVICNAIENQYFDYLEWKKIKVIDSVMATLSQALNAFANENLSSFSILYKK